MKLRNKEKYDVLVINNHLDLIDMFQSFMGEACLGTFFQDGMSKMYFKDGMKNQMEISKRPKPTTISPITAPPLKDIFNPLSKSICRFCRGAPPMSAPNMA